MDFSKGSIKSLNEEELQSIDKKLIELLKINKLLAKKSTAKTEIG